jgi:hypothetical protein
MHALVAPVLLRLAGRDPLRLDPGLDHSNRKARQPSHADRGERRTLSERSLSGRPNSRNAASSTGHTCWPIGSGQRLAAQQIAARRVGERQRLATRPLAGQKPALEINTPDVVGRPAMGEGRARGRAPATQLALHRQPFPIEQEPNRARRRPGDPRPRRSRKARAFKGPQVGWARRTARQRSASSSPIAQGRLSGARERSSKPSIPALPIAPNPFVASLPAHPEPPADRRKRLLALLNRNHKAHPLVHGAGLHPSHRQGPPRRPVDLSPMSSV